MGVPGRLTQTQLRAWRSLMLMGFQLTAELNRELLDATGLSYQDYIILAVLADRDEGRMRAFELGREIGWEKSRLSHHVARMSDRGLVRRERSASDQRGAFVVVTTKGKKAVAVAAPVHEAAVRRLFVEVATPAELDVVAKLSGRVLARLAAHGTTETRGLVSA